MRYIDTGELHKDFHLATNATISYVLEKYGYGFLEELFRRTAQLVYKDIYEKLKMGDSEALLEYWRYYYHREGGLFKITKSKGEIVFHVTRCPAAEHVELRTGNVPETFFFQTELLNRGWSDGTPFEIESQRIGSREYKMILRESGSAAE